MEFYSLDVQSTVNINGKDVAFDYNNTYLTLDEAIERAKNISQNDDTLHVAVHRWILNPDGTEHHADDEYINGIFIDSIPFSYTNKNHREWEK